jgi:phosphohistidine phosphatase
MSADLYIIRHTEAEERDAAIWPDDRLRALTGRGRKRFRRLAKSLRELEPCPQRLFSSRYVRAWDTAQIAHEAATWPRPESLSVLEERPAAEIVQVLQSLNEPKCVAIVGHEPVLSEAVSILLAGDERRISIDLEKGGIVLLHFKQRIESGAATLRWYVTPTTVRRRK